MSLLHNMYSFIQQEYTPGMVSTYLFGRIDVHVGVGGPSPGLHFDLSIYLPSTQYFFCTLVGSFPPFSVLVCLTLSFPLSCAESTHSHHLNFMLLSPLFYSGPIDVDLHTRLRRQR